MSDSTLSIRLKLTDDSTTTRKVLLNHLNEDGSCSSFKSLSQLALERLIKWDLPYIPLGSRFPPNLPLDCPVAASVAPSLPWIPFGEIVVDALYDLIKKIECGAQTRQTMSVITGHPFREYPKLYPFANSREHLLIYKELENFQKLNFLHLPCPSSAPMLLDRVFGPLTGGTGMHHLSLDICKPTTIGLSKSCNGSVWKVLADYLILPGNHVRTLTLGGHLEGLGVLLDILETNPFLQCINILDAISERLLTRILKLSSIKKVRVPPSTPYNKDGLNAEGCTVAVERDVKLLPADAEETHIEKVLRYLALQILNDDLDRPANRLVAKCLNSFTSLVIEKSTMSPSVIRDQMNCRENEWILPSETKRSFTGEEDLSYLLDKKVKRTEHWTLLRGKPRVNQSQKNMENQKSFAFLRGPLSRLQELPVHPLTLKMQERQRRTSWTLEEQLNSSKRR